MPRKGYVVAKFGNMRKAEEFCVSPRPTNVTPDYDIISMKSDHRHVRFSAGTGVGVLSRYDANYPNIDKGGATAIVVPTEVIEAAKEQMPKPGDRIGGVIIIG